MKWQYFQRTKHTGRTVYLVLWYDSVYFNQYPSGFLQWYWGNHAMGLLPDTQHCGLRVYRECTERFHCHGLQRKLLVSDPGMHHGTCVTHVPWCMSGSLTPGGMRNPRFYVSGKRPIAQMPVKQPQIILANLSHESTRKDDMKYQNNAHQTLCTFSKIKNEIQNKWLQLITAV